MMEFQKESSQITTRSFRANFRIPEPECETDNSGKVLVTQTVQEGRPAIYLYSKTNAEPVEVVLSDSLHPQVFFRGNELARPGTDIDDFVAELCAEDPELGAMLSEARQEIAEEYFDGELSVRNLRLQAGLSQQELAAAMNTSQPYIAKLEAGKTDPRWSTVVRLADVLGCSMDQLKQAIGAGANA